MLILITIIPLSYFLISPRCTVPYGVPISLDCSYVCDPVGFRNVDNYNKSLFIIINSERYLATHHCYSSYEKLTCDRNITSCDNISVYNYPFALMSILNTRHTQCHPCPVQYWARDIYLVMQDWQIPSRSLLSLSMFRKVPINCLYNYPVTDNVRSATKYFTPHLGYKVVSGLRVVYTIITMRV